MAKPTSHRQYVAGKGDWRREAQISDEEMQSNWDQVFGKKPKAVTIDPKNLTHMEECHYSQDKSSIDKIRRGLENGEVAFLTWLGDRCFDRGARMLAREAFMAGRESR
jgi:hypothetical protein